MHVCVTSPYIYILCVHCFLFLFQPIRFVPDLDDIVSFEDLMKEEGEACMPEEAVASARSVSVRVWRCEYVCVCGGGAEDACVWVD